MRQLLVKQTLNEKELKEIFANIKKAPQREVWLSLSLIHISEPTRR